MSAWADALRVLGNRAGHAAIHCRIAVTPYLREIMDALGPRSPARRVVFMKGSQLGGTEAANNWLGFVMHHSPGPILGWLPWSAAVAEFIEAKENPLRLKNWIKTRERNEALDLEVSCLAALYILGPGFVKSLPERATALARRVEAPAEADPAPASAAPRRSGWITGWRG